MNIHPDAIFFVSMVVFFCFGFIAGRWEKQDAQVRTYKLGFNIGKQVGRNESE
jgi:hypothetical protein